MKGDHRGAVICVIPAPQPFFSQNLPPSQIPAAAAALRRARPGPSPPRCRSRGLSDELKKKKRLTARLESFSPAMPLPSASFLPLSVDKSRILSQFVRRPASSFLAGSLAPAPQRRRQGACGSRPRSSLILLIIDIYPSTILNSTYPG